MNWIIDRLKEPSTYAGFAGLAMAFRISSDQYQVYANAVAAIAAVIAIFTAERPAAQ